MGTHAPKRVLLPHANRVIFSLPVFWTAIFTWAALQRWNSEFMEYLCLCQVQETCRCLGPAVEAVGDNISCLWRYLGRYLTQLWESAGGTCLTSCCAWWKKKSSRNQHFGTLQQGNLLSWHQRECGCVTWESQDVACWIRSYSTGQNCWERDCGCPCPCSASARQGPASLQDCESLGVKSGNCDPEEGELREGLPPEDGAEISRQTRRADWTTEQWEPFQD